MPTVSAPFGRIAQGASVTSIEATTVGSVYYCLYDCYVVRIYAYINDTVSNKACTAAIYLHSDLSLIAASNEITLGTGTSWRNFPFPTLPHINKGNYVLVVNAQSTTGVATLAYDAGAVNQGHTEALAHTSFPDNPMVATHNDNQYSIYAYTIPDREYLQTTIRTDRRGHSTNTVCNMRHRF